MALPFENDTAARELLEALRWPQGPHCPRCGAGGAEVFLIGGEKRSHREGLYQCKPCRRHFSVTIGTPLERLRVPLSTWVRAAHAFSYDGPAYGKGGKPPLTQLEAEIGVSYRTVLRMRDIIKRTAGKYRGYKSGFGAWPRSFMKHQIGARPTKKHREAKRKLLEQGKHPSQRSIRATGVLACAMRGNDIAGTPAAFNRTEQLLRLLLASSKLHKRRSGPTGRGSAHQAGVCLAE